MPRRAATPILSPARLDLGVYRGDSLSVRLQLRAHGVPIDLTDADDGLVHWEFAAFMRKSVGGPKVVDVEVVVLYGLVGILLMNFPPEVTQKFPGSSVWDLQTTDPVGRVRTILRGMFSVQTDITYED